MKTVKVHTTSPYEVCIARGLLASAGQWLAELTVSRVAAIIADDTVDALYGDTVARALGDAGFTVKRKTFTHGECNKTIATYATLLDFLAENRLTRSDTVVALGGGVTGDMAGFAAAKPAMSPVTPPPSATTVSLRVKRFSARKSSSVA